MGKFSNWAEKFLSTAALQLYWRIMLVSPKILIMLCNVTALVTFAYSVKVTKLAQHKLQHLKFINIR